MSYEISYSKSKGFLKLWERKENGRRNCVRKFPEDTLVKILLTAIESFDEQVEEVCNCEQCEVPQEVKEEAAELVEKDAPEEVEVVERTIEEEVEEEIKEELEEERVEQVVEEEGENSEEEVISF